MKRFLPSLTLTLLAGSLIAVSAFAGDWYNWRGPLQTGFSPETNLPSKWSEDPADPENNFVWKAPYGCRSAPLVMNGRVFFINNVGNKSTEQERVMCLDADTGKMIWEHKFNVWHTDIVSVRLGWTVLAGDPATGNIYAHGTQGSFFCFNRDGKILWQRSLTEEFGRISGYGGRVTSPVVSEDLVIIGLLNTSWGDQGKSGTRFLAMDKLTGNVVWWSEVGSAPKDTFYSVPVVAEFNGEKVVISGGADGGVYAVQLRTGKPVWGYVFGTGSINCSPVVEGNYVYIGHGEESPDNNVQGRVICLDAGKIEKGKPAEVWHKDGIKARYTSPIIHEDKLFITDEIGKLYLLDAKTGKQQWKYSYGTNSRGSPVLADGKIYVAEVNSKFHILKPGAKSCESLDAHFFPSPDGTSDVELNGTPAIANGRVYFSTGDEVFCIGAKKAVSSKEAATEPKSKVVFGKPAQLQIVPADVVMMPGETVAFKARVYDEKGNFLKDVTGDWSLPIPPTPPGAKSAPPALDGKLAENKLTVSDKKPAQQGYLEARAEGLSAKARIRVAPRAPYMQDFTQVPDGAVPGGWVNTQGKFVVKTLPDGNKVLAKVTDKPSPLVAKGNAYIGMPTLHDYTIEADLMGGKLAFDMPDMGIIANRYVLTMSGNIQKLRITSWDALPRIDETINFPWEAGKWYRAKLTVVPKGESEATVRGKVWLKDTPEPAEWTVEAMDPRPNFAGSPGLYGYVTGIPEGGSGTDIFYDNVRITPNSK